MSHRSQRRELQDESGDFREKEIPQKRKRIEYRLLLAEYARELLRHPELYEKVVSQAEVNLDALRGEILLGFPRSRQHLLH